MCIVKCVGALGFLFALQASALADFQNGDFEQDLSVGWTITGPGAARIQDGDSDSDYEAKLSWTGTASPIGTSQSPPPTRMTQTVILYDLRQQISFTVYIDNSTSGNGGGLGTLTLILSSESAVELDRKTYFRYVVPRPGIPARRNITIDLLQWAHQANAKVDEKLQLRVEAYVSGLAPSQAGSAFAEVILDDVKLEPLPVPEKDAWMLY